MVKNGNVEPEWTTLLGKLRTNEAALLPGAEEAEGKLRRFTLLPRLTPHVRHRAKYFEVQLAGGQEFVFTDHGKTIGPPGSIIEGVCLFVGEHTGGVTRGTRAPGRLFPMDCECVPRQSLGIGRSKNRTAPSARSSRRRASRQMAKLIQERYGLST